MARKQVCKIGINKCSVCKKNVEDINDWWGNPYNACVSCIRKAVIQMRIEKKKYQED